MVAASQIADHDNHAVPIPDSEEKVLRTGVLYGANGAGKSNLFKALSYLRSMALNTHPRKTGTAREPFRFGGLDAPSTFDLHFIAQNKLFRFGFKLDNHRILGEWLVHVVGEHENVIYERSDDESGKSKIDVSGLGSSGEKVSSLAKAGETGGRVFPAI